MWRYATWSKLIKGLLTAVIPLPWYLLLDGLVGSTVHTPPQPPPVTIGTVAVTDPLSVAIGAHDSLYVLDQTHILHFSGSGHLLGQRGPADRGTTIATDRTGDLYYVRQQRLVNLALTGERWPGTALAARRSMAVPGHRARGAWTRSPSSATTPWLACAWPGRTRTLMRWSVSPAKGSSGWVSGWVVQLRVIVAVPGHARLGRAKPC